MNVFSKEALGYQRDAEVLGRLQARTVRLESEGIINPDQSLAARVAIRNLRRQVIIKLVELTNCE